MVLDGIVIVSLDAPKEKVWGRLVARNAAGITIQEIDRNCFDDGVQQALERKPAVLTPTTVFYPMHRVERIAQDEPSGSIPSLARRFLERVGISLLDYL